MATGGDDGLQGMQHRALARLFRFDIYGRTAYLLRARRAILCVFLVARALVNSPFGLALLGARENPRRMMALGAPIGRDDLRMFAIASAMAGVAGALLPQTTQFVSPELCRLPALGRRAGDPDHRRHRQALWRLRRRDRSIYGCARLVLGASSPVYWYFWIGLLLVIVVAFFRRRIVPSVETLAQRLRRR